MTTQLYLIAAIGGTRVAICSAAVESVVKVGDIVPIPRAESAVLGLLAVRSRVLTLIDGHSRVYDSPPPVTGPMAIISEHLQHSYGLVVDAVEDVISLDDGDFMPVAGIDRHWAPFVTAIVPHAGAYLLVVDHGALLTGSCDRRHEAIAA